MKTISRTTSLTKAQIDALHSTPVEILLAPNAGKGLVILGAQIWKTAGSGASTGTNELQLVYSDTTSTSVCEFLNVDSANGALAATQNRIQYAGFASAGSVAIPISGDGVSIKASGAITAGTGTILKVKIDFQVIDL